MKAKATLKRKTPMKRGKPLRASPGKTAGKSQALRARGKSAKPPFTTSASRGRASASATWGPLPSTSASPPPSSPRASGGKTCRSRLSFRGGRVWVDFDAGASVEIDDAALSRFWGKVDRSGACWVWTGARGRRGYGVFSVHCPAAAGIGRTAKHARAHRLSWAIANQAAPPPDMDVMHSCDNPRCVNPDHLSTGTRLDNMRDCSQKGRVAKGDESGARRHPERLARGDRHGSKTMPHTVPRGARNGAATIKERDARNIRKMQATGLGKVKISRALGLPVGAVAGVVSGRSWAWLT